MISGFFLDKWHISKDWNYFKIAKWVFYFCGAASFFLAFGVYAIIEARDPEKYGICVLFSVACIFSAIMMIVQRVWQIKYNRDALFFRNSLGISKKYMLKNLRLVEDHKMTRLICGTETLTKWDSLIMDVRGEMALYQALRSSQKHP